MKQLILQIIILFTVVGCNSVQNPPEMSGCAHFDNVDFMDPFKLLEKSQCFRIGGVGWGGRTPPEEIALRKIMKREDASAALEELYSKGSSAGKLYALLGLRFANKAKYDELLPQLRQNTDKVATQAGCIVFEKTVQEIVSLMEAGNYDLAIEKDFPKKVSTLHEETSDFCNQDPVRFLEMLKVMNVSQSQCPTFTVMMPCSNWPRKEHIPALIELLDSNEPCANVNAAISSIYDCKPSTIGKEAAYLIEGYREGRYPPGLNSGRANIDKEELKHWWETLIIIRR
jgi:hypothetical protein